MNRRKSLSKYDNNPVFSTKLFSILALRLIRKHLILQYVDSGDRILFDENVLIQKVKSEIKTYLTNNPPRWSLPPSIGKAAFTRRIRFVARSDLKHHDMGSSIKNAALEGVYKEEFGDILPDGWLTNDRNSFFSNIDDN